MDNEANLRHELARGIQDQQRLRVGLVDNELQIKDRKLPTTTGMETQMHVTGSWNRKILDKVLQLYIKEVFNLSTSWQMLPF